MTSLYERLRDAARDASAITLRAELISASAIDTDERQMVFPPTFVDVGHLVSPVREDGTHEYVLIDSTQSWANRLEEIADDASVGLPRIEVAVGESVISAFKLPHRVFDAILRDSELDGQGFRKSPIGKALIDARASNATALFRHAPTVLLFGGWDSFGGLKVGAAKWPAALAGQILGFDATLAQKAGVRSDPLEITIDRFEAYKAKDPAEFWTTDQAAAELSDKGKPTVLHPAEVGHGNIPAKPLTKGAWVRSIELRSSLSLTRLRRYHFPDADGATSGARDHAAVTLLACLSVLLLAERMDRGLDLRAGAELDATTLRWAVRRGLAADQAFDVTVAAARVAFESAVKAADEQGLEFAPTVRYQAKQKLRDLIEQRS